MTATHPIGFIGIGNMGAPMVRCLAKGGHKVLMYDLRRAAMEPAIDAANGIAAANAPSEIAAQCHIVITMLPESRHVHDAILGANGIVGHGFGTGRVVIDMSSSFPLDTRALGTALTAKEIGLVDAPVSGGVGKAVTGTLAIIMIQFMTIAISFTFFMLSNRMNLGFVPLRDYSLFVEEAVDIYSHE